MKFMDKLKFYKNEYDEFKRGKSERDRIYEEQQLEEFESEYNVKLHYPMVYLFEDKEFKHFVDHLNTGNEAIHFIGNAEIVKKNRTGAMLKYHTEHYGVILITDWGVRFISLNNGMKIDEHDLTKIKSVYVEDDLIVFEVGRSKKKYKIKGNNRNIVDIVMKLKGINK